ncbi:MAG: sodium:alanine symporter family protein, partial [Lachnospiraceae bacterium]|nr:sodium:alanine symporter family protein [Lachnospiraceae bacterium]
MIENLHFLVWGPWTLFLFLGTGLWFTIRSGFFQFRGIWCWWGETVGSLWRDEEEQKGEKKSESSITRFQSACTALAATIGTGNIAGVATALT